MQSGSPPAGDRRRLPPLKALQAFEAVSRQLTFAQGAEALGVTPSAVSHQIQQLEEFLGVPLFRREAGRATLTSAGQTYAQEIRSAFTLILNATDLVAPSSQAGQLVIASSPSFATKWLQKRLPDFLKGHPDIQVRLFTISSDELPGKDRWDIAIVHGRPPAPQSHTEPLLTEKLYPLCAPGLAASLRLRTPGDLSRVTLIHSKNALSWSEYFRRIGISEVRPLNELWLNPSSMAIGAAVDGLGVILESELLAEQELRDGQLVALFESAEFGVETSSYFLVRPAGFRNGPQVARFERWLRSSVKHSGAVAAAC